MATGSGPSLMMYLAALVLSAGCTPPAVTPTATIPACAESGQFSGDLFGAIEVSVDWRNSGLECEGMPRPNQEGARLRFAGTAATNDDTTELAFILAVPRLARGQTGAELPTNVTLIEEGSGTFFGTGDTESCWTDIHQHERIGNENSMKFEIAGILYCVAPLAELNGMGSVTLRDVSFAGQVNWEIEE